MALRTNSKKAKENLLAYVNESLNYEEYDFGGFQGFAAVKYEYMTEEGIFPRGEMTFQNFKSWAQGLTCGGLFLYFYNVEAKEVLKNILEETNEEADRFTEEEAENCLTYLIYNNCYKLNVNKQVNDYIRSVKEEGNFSHINYLEG